MPHWCHPAAQTLIMSFIRNVPSAHLQNSCLYFSLEAMRSRLAHVFSRLRVPFTKSASIISKDWTSMKQPFYRSWFLLPLLIGCFLGGIPASMPQPLAVSYCHNVVKQLLALKTGVRRNGRTEYREGQSNAEGSIVFIDCWTENRFGMISWQTPLRIIG